MDKKGQGEQFNWIFVIVAGAIILSFFTVFTFKYIELQERRQNTELGRTFGENIQLLEASGIQSYFIDDTSFKLGVMAQFDYLCYENQSTLQINKDFAQDIKDQVLFAPESARVNSFDAWILSWDYPYYIVNMIYLSEPSRQYFLVSDVNTREYVQDLDVPLIFNIEKIDKRIPVEADGRAKATVMYFTKPGREDFAQIQEEFVEYTVMFVDPDKEEITFYDADGKVEGKEPYYGEALLYGALFSSHIDAYACGLSRAMGRLDRTTNVYSTKALLLNRVVGDAACSYSGIQQTLAKYPGELERDGGASIRKALVEQNEGLGGKGCPVVF